MLLTQAVTVTIEKGDILGAVMLLIVIVPAFSLVGMLFYHLGVNGGKQVVRDLPIFAVGLLLLGGVGWVLWWIAHWFTSG